MNRLKRTGYFYRSLISYLLIFFIPILIFASIFQTRYKKVLQDELIMNNYNQLNVLKVNIDNELSQLNYIVHQFIVSDDTTPFYLEENQLRAFAMQDKLRQYRSTNAFIYDIAYYFHGHKYIYTAASSHTVQKYISTIYDYKTWDYDAFINDTEHSKSSFARARDQIHEFDRLPRYYTTFIHPISKDGIHHFATLMFLISESSFQTKINQVYNNDYATTFLLDKNRALITTVNPNAHISEDNYASLLSLLPADNHSMIISVDGSDYIMSSTISEQSGWLYINFISIESVLKVASDLQIQFISILILILLGGAVLISMLMAINYSPIRRLQKLSENVIAGNNSEGNSNEIDAIKGAINYLSEQNLELSEAIDESKLASKEYLVGQLLSGQHLQIDCIDNQLIHRIMSPNYSNYHSFIVTISCDTSQWQNLKFELIESIENFSNDNHLFVCKESIIKNSIITAVLCDKTSHLLMSDLLETIRCDLSGKWKIGVTLGVGNTYHSLDDFPRSYMEASIATDYRHMIGTDRLISYSTIIENMKEMTDYPYSELKLFKNAIKKGNVRDIDTILNDIMKLFGQNGMPLFVARGICFEIINIVTDNAKNSETDSQELFKKYPDVFSITKYESVYKIIEIVKLISYDVCKSLNETYDNDYKILISNMRGYIEDNYTDPDFTLQSMADHYNMQKTNLSTFYKEHSGVNIFELLTDLRMATAEELLRNSQLPVKQICFQIGYDNVSSFIRRFKQIHGITPGKYRLLAKEES